MRNEGRGVAKREGVEGVKVKGVLRACLIIVRQKHWKAACLKRKCRVHPFQESVEVPHMLGHRRNRRGQHIFQCGRSC
jgi:hypothetical protein